MATAIEYGLAKLVVKEGYLLMSTAAEVSGDTFVGLVLAVGADDGTEGSLPVRKGDKVFVRSFETPILVPVPGVQFAYLISRRDVYVVLP